MIPLCFSVISPIDGKSMESITSVKIFHGSEFKANGKVIRWTEVTQTHRHTRLSLWWIISKIRPTGPTGVNVEPF